MLVAPNDEDRAAVDRLFSVDEMDAVAADLARSMIWQVVVDEDGFVVERGGAVEWYRLSADIKLRSIEAARNTIALAIAHARTRNNGVHPEGVHAT